MKKFITCCTAVALLFFTLSVAANAKKPRHRKLPKSTENMSEVKFVPQILKINENGHFGAKTWKEMDSREVYAVAMAICTYYGCEGEVVAIKAIIHNNQVTIGNDFAITGVIHKHQGEEWWIAYPPPPGYVTCSARYDPKTVSANTGDYTNGQVFRGPAGDWVGSYSVVPLNRPEGHWVIVNFIAKYVKAGTEARHSCVANGTTAWHVDLKR